MSEANKDLVRRWQEAYNTGALDVLDEILDPNWATNSWPAGVPQTVEVAKAMGAAMLALLPDYHCRIDEMVAEADRVTVRWTAHATHTAEVMGLAPTGRPLEWGGMSLFQVARDRIVGHWAFSEELTMLEALGAELAPEWVLTQHRSTQTRALSDDERIRLQRQAVAEHVRLEIDKDWPAVHQTFVADGRASFELVPLSVAMPGIEGVQAFYEAMDAAMPDFTVTVTSECDVPGTTVVEATISGTHKGEYCGIPASGRAVTFELAAFFIFGAGDQAGKIITERAYFDNETVLRQMRGEPDAPTGLGLARRMA